MNREDTLEKVKLAYEILHNRINKKAKIHIKEYVFANSKKSKENKDNVVKTWLK